MYSIWIYGNKQWSELPFFSSCSIQKKVIFDKDSNWQWKMDLLEFKMKKITVRFGLHHFNLNGIEGGRNFFLCYVGFKKNSLQTVWILTNCYYVKLQWVSGLNDVLEKKRSLSEQKKVDWCFFFTVWYHLFYVLQMCYTKWSQSWDGKFCYLFHSLSVIQTSWKNLKEFIKSLIK